MVVFKNAIGKPSVGVSIEFQRNSEVVMHAESSAAVEEMDFTSSLATSSDGLIGAHPVVGDDLLEPVLINDEYFLIGGPSEGQNLYSISVTLSFAEHLQSLFPAFLSFWPPPRDMPCHFQFMLLGKHISFHDFNEYDGVQKFGERATARVRCTPSCLLQFVMKMMPELTIYLNLEHQTLARVVVAIKDKIEQYGMQNHFLRRLHMEPINISGVFPVTAMFNEPLPDDAVHSTMQKPSLGVVFLVHQIKDAHIGQDPQPPHSSVVVSSSNINHHPDNTLAGDHRQHEQLDALVYATALELEVWKEEQKLLEQEKQKYSETAQLEMLNSEYRRQVYLSKQLPSLFVVPLSDNFTSLVCRCL